MRRFSSSCQIIDMTEDLQTKQEIKDRHYMLLSILITNVLLPCLPLLKIPRVGTGQTSWLLSVNLIKWAANYTTRKTALDIAH